MKVLMLGWEFPPRKVGGLGTHCYELTKELGDLVELVLVLPFKARPANPRVKILVVPANWGDLYNPRKLGFFESVDAYNEMIVQRVMSLVSKGKLDFDIIHAHDWITMRAGVKLKRLTGKPLVLTVHATEYDRTAGNPWDFIRNIEKRGIKNADLIIAVSNLMKERLVKHYGADPGKIRVIYNGIDPNMIRPSNRKGLFGKKLVLYLSRVTIQKNPEAFIRAIPLVLQKRKDVHFIVAGDGDSLPHLIHLAVDLGVIDHVTFTGRVTEEEKEFLYSIADAYVLPSVSEPFGITVLEAAAHGTIPIISKTVGAGEKIRTLKVDFWDIEKLATYILGVLKYDVLRKEVTRANLEDLMDLSWKRVAEQTVEAYKEVLGWN